MHRIVCIRKRQVREMQRIVCAKQRKTGKVIQIICFFSEIGPEGTETRAGAMRHARTPTPVHKKMCSRTKSTKNAQDCMRLLIDFPWFSLIFIHSGILHRYRSPVLISMHFYTGIAALWSYLYIFALSMHFYTGIAALCSYLCIFTQVSQPCGHICTFLHYLCIFTQVSQPCAHIYAFLHR